MTCKPDMKIRDLDTYITVLPVFAARWSQTQQFAKSQNAVLEPTGVPVTGTPPMTKFFLFLICSPFPLYILILINGRQYFSVLRCGALLGLPTD